MLVLVDVLPHGGIFIKQFRQMVGDMPIVASDGLDSPALWMDSDSSANNTFVISAFDHSFKNPGVEKFSKKYKKWFNKNPDFEASQGYECVMTLKQVYSRTESVLPLIASSSLKYGDPIKGITSEFTFSSIGDVVGKKIYIKEMVNGKFFPIK